MDERSKLAFDLAKEIATQLITSSTGFLALTITFTKELLTKIPAGSQKLLIAAWGLHLLSITFGVWTLMALTGTVSPLDIVDLPKDWVTWTFAENVRVPAALQVFAFVGGTGAMVFYASSALKKVQ